MTVRTWACGHEAIPANTIPNPTRGLRCQICRDKTAQRNKAMISDYLSGMLRRDLAEKYGITISYISLVFTRAGIKLPRVELEKRLRLPSHRPSPGRPRVWPDVPKHLEREYDLLRRGYGISSVDARAAIEKDLIG